jgi:hypothetical protein
MDRRKFLGIMGLAGAAAAIPISAELTAGASAATSGEPTVTELPDGSLSIVGHIQYAHHFKGYVVQALVPAGSFGQYLITNPNEQLLSGLAERGDLVIVQGRLDEGSLLLMVQNISSTGKPPGAAPPGAGPKVKTPPKRP